MPVDSLRSGLPDLYDIILDKPSVRISEAGLIGNGRMGVAVLARPDAVQLLFGHNSVWDTRAAQVPEELYGTFENFWEKYKEGEKGDEAASAWTDEYSRKTMAGYDGKSPRPLACGTLVLGFDRRKVEVLGHRVRLADGVCQVNLLIHGSISARLEVIISPTSDRLWVHTIREDGQPLDAILNRVEWISETGAETAFRCNDSRISIRQAIPHRSDDPRPREAVRLTARIAGTFDITATERVQKMKLDYGIQGKTIEEEPNSLGSKIPSVLRNVEWTGADLLCVELEHGDANIITGNLGDPPEPTKAAMDEVLSATQDHWAFFWSRSEVCLEDQSLARAWYRCLYLHGCSASRDAVQPGLYGPWVAEKFGWAWHSDYHLDYNAQQTIWGLFSSNHYDLHLPYVRMIHDWLPCHKRYARAFYDLPGVAYTVSLYPCVSDTPPSPSPPWNMMMCVPPWAVQSLWWHYMYSQDESYLRDLGFEPIKQVTLFLNSYMRRPEAHGPGSPWNDEKFHLYPTFVPEMRHAFGFSSDPQYNDCLVDLTLTRFVFNAYLQACAILEIEMHEVTLMNDVREVLANFPDYVVAEHPLGGQVYRDVKGSDPDTIYNCPNPMCHVFPGEELGLHSSSEELETARNTWQTHRNEGGNELVFMAVQGARLGVLDLEKWKRQLRYCELPNGSFTNMILQVGGRYPEGFPFSWMETMGIWTENFAVPMVINECLLQSYHGEIRFFPNWPLTAGSARFRHLRAVGAFLVSAKLIDGAVCNIEIFSEKGADCTVVNPWENKRVALVRNGNPAEILAGTLLRFPTTTNESIALSVDSDAIQFTTGSITSPQSAKPRISEEFADSV